jgi:predicted ArsR family transcriptional regulator
MVKRTKSPAEVQSAVLTLKLLERLVMQDGPLGVTALASALETTKDRAHRHLRTLVQQGYVAQLPGEKYCVGRGSPDTVYNKIPCAGYAALVRHTTAT